METRGLAAAAPRKFSSPAAAIAMGAIALALCGTSHARAFHSAARPTSAGAHDSTQRPPYPPSRLIRAVRWSFSAAKRLRKANGSDIWPCTWAIDDALYCAWGDGGGFQGTNDIGRVSLGFARVTGTPRAAEPSSYRGRNLWGAPPYAEYPADFGGKVGSLIAVGGILYGAGGLWTDQNSKHPVSTWQDGNLHRLIWSNDLGQSWHIATWTPKEDLGSYLQFGRDRENAPGGYVYDYFSRPNDSTHLYLKRIAATELERASEYPPHAQYLAFRSRTAQYVSWSPRPADAIPVFTDLGSAIGPAVVFDAALARYLLTIGHDPSGRPQDEAPGELGLFEAPHPWGPWRTVDYRHDWGRFPSSTHGDYLGLTFPAKWISADGRTLWGVFSGPGPLDAFNVVRARLVTSGHRSAARRHAPELARCREHFNGVNATTFTACPDPPAP